MYANISLTEVYFLIYLDKINKLPNEILIGIAANNDNGGSIIRYQGELPLKYIVGVKSIKIYLITELNFFHLFTNIFLFQPFLNIDYMNLYQILFETFSNKVFIIND